jgi:hypothetical protein
MPLEKQVIKQDDDDDDDDDDGLFLTDNIFF